MIMASYADESYDKKQQEIIAVGSYFGIPERFFEVERQWQAYLEKNNIDYFRSSECNGLTGEFDPSKRKMSLNSARAFADSVRYDLAQLLRDEHGITGIALALFVPDFWEVVQQSKKARHYYGNIPLSFSTIP